MAAGALFTGANGRFMMVRPTYKDYWDIPGGYIELGESPRDACLREIREELNLTPQLGPLLVVDWAPRQDEGDKLLFIFDAGPLTTDHLDTLRLQADELAEYAFVTIDEARSLTLPRLWRRLNAELDAHNDGTTSYLEHGEGIHTDQTA